MAKPRLGDVLKAAGAVSDADLDVAVQEQKDRSILLGELLLQKGLVSKKQLVDALQKITRIPYVDCRTVEVDKEALEFLTRELALRYCCLPLALQGRKLVMVIREPQNLQLLDELRFITGLEISPRLGFPHDIKAAIDTHYSPESSPTDEEAAQEAALEDSGPDMEFFTASSREKAKEAIKEFQASLRSKPTAAVRLLSSIILGAESRKASDLHIDPQAMDTVVRVRVDGILHDLLQVPQELTAQLVSRIKILADLDIAERRAPQDGRFLVRIKGRKIDLRVSTLPTHYGEKVVMRFLNPDSTRVRFVDLGFSAEHARALSQVLARSQGLVLVSGPTGSGKTTTLYAALHHLSARSVNIITVEDPVEYMLEGINQVQVNKKAGLTFASCLRSILRQDPNIVMVGEIRDKETAEIALTAAQTGHLVLSTIHTNDGIAAVDRLRDLGVAPFLIASSATAVLAQRLLRKLCSCRKEGSPPPGYAAFLPELADGHPATKTYLPVGCERCDGTGYKGRVGVYEVVIISEEVRRLIQVGAPTDQIRASVARSGVPFMSDDALDKLKSGLTSIEEVLRVIPIKERDSLSCQNCGKDLGGIFAFCPHCGSKTGEIGAVKEPRIAAKAGI